MNDVRRMAAGPFGGVPPGTGFGPGVLSGGTVGGVPGSGGSGEGIPPGCSGCSGELGNGLSHIVYTLEQMPDQPVGEPVPNWKPPARPARAAMEGRHCTLEPLDAGLHADELWRAFSRDTSKRNWTYLASEPPETRDELRRWIDQVQSGADPLFFAIVVPAHGAAGIASYLRIAPEAGTIEVGHIHLSPLLQRTVAATEAMYLMMRHAFALGYRRYEWKCDALNAPSRAAAERLGFTFEGIFRQALVYKGRNRDTAWYSVIDREWPWLRGAYEQWLAPQNFDAAGSQRSRLSEFVSSARMARSRA